MSKVMTACGPIETSQLGQTLIHEHLIMALPGWEFDVDTVFDEEELISRICKEVNAAKARGIGTVVDAGFYDPKRMPTIYAEVQKRTGVNVILATGSHNPGTGVCHYWISLMGLGHDREALTDRWARSFIRDIEVGMDGTDVKAGLLKVATSYHPDHAMDAFELMMFEAAGRAQKATGVPVITHTEVATCALQQADALLAAGASPDKIAIGHLCDTHDIDYLEAVLKKGVYINFDRMSMSYTAPEGEIGKMKTIVELVKRGWGKKIMLGHDRCVALLGGDLPKVGMLQTESFLKGADMSYWRLDGICEYHLPNLKKMGLTQEQIDDLMINNPARFFA